ncbi:E3 ubiquitin-protein ligase RNF5-like [Zophobas morio]|uniref:E3 ubiquitin-protein ligase RNF5-like n=1 Tax=Zophobas morio TaxID=2755281 RepID=UPI0030829BA2
MRKVSEGEGNENVANGNNKNRDHFYSDFECNICLSSPVDPVITLCGHLFCWPCLSEWLEYHAKSLTCPVCKANVNRDNVIPVYGRSNKNPQDPRTKTQPPRPKAKRMEGRSCGPFTPSGSSTYGGNFSFSAGLGFPFPFATFGFRFGNPLNDFSYTRFREGRSERDCLYSRLLLLAG